MQALENGLFGARIDRRESIVQDQNGGVPGDRAGNSRSLLLAARERDAALADERIRPLGHWSRSFSSLERCSASRMRDSVASASEMPNATLSRKEPENKKVS